MRPHNLHTRSGCMKKIKPVRYSSNDVIDSIEYDRATTQSYHSRSKVVRAW